MNEANSYAQKIKELRSSLNMTQTAFSKLIGCTQTTLSSYENGNVMPSLDTIINIANNCDVSIDWLCGVTEQKRASNQIKSYSDAFKLLTSVLDFLSFDNIYISVEIFSGEDVVNIKFIDKSFTEFLAGYKKMKEALNENLIDDEIYKLWKEKTYKKFEDSDVTFEEMPLDMIKDPE